MSKKSNITKNVIKLLLVILVILLMLPLILKISVLFKDISTEEGRLAFKDQITNLGFKGIFIILGLTIIQIFLLVLPGEPVEILAGMCYGSIGGLIIIYIGVFISSAIIILLINKYGKNIIYSFVEKDKIEKLENSKIFKTGNLDLILIILFALPGTPKDLITYMGAILPIRPLKFIMISTFARFPSIITSTIMGNNLLEGNWFFIIGVYVITFAISGIFIYFYNKRNKKQKITDIMKV